MPEKSPLVVTGHNYAKKEQFVSALERLIGESLFLQTTAQLTETDRITFERATFHFSDFSGLYLQGCAFKDCTFTCLCHFNLGIRLDDITFTGSTFEGGMVLHEQWLTAQLPNGVTQLPDGLTQLSSELTQLPSGLMKGDYSCSSFTLKPPNDASQYSPIDSATIVEGYRKNLDGTIDPFAHLDRKDKNNITFIALQLIFQGRQNSPNNTIAKRAVLYAIAEKRLIPNTTLSTLEMNDFIDSRVTQFAGITIQRDAQQNAQTNPINFSRNNLSGLNFGNVTFENAVNLVGTCLGNVILNDVRFRNGVIVSLFTGVAGADTEFVNCDLTKTLCNQIQLCFFRNDPNTSSRFSSAKFIDDFSLHLTAFFTPKEKNETRLAFYTLVEDAKREPDAFVLQVLSQMQLPDNVSIAQKAFQRAFLIPYIRSCFVLSKFSQLIADDVRSRIPLEDEELLSKIKMLQAFIVTLPPISPDIAQLALFYVTHLGGSKKIFGQAIKSPFQNLNDEMYYQYFVDAFETTITPNATRMLDILKKPVRPTTQHHGLFATNPSTVESDLDSNDGAPPELPRTGPNTPTSE